MREGGDKRRSFKERVSIKLQEGAHSAVNAVVAAVAEEEEPLAERGSLARTKKVAPTTPPLSSSFLDVASPQTPLQRAFSSVKDVSEIPLAETKTGLLRHAITTTLDGVATAIFSILLILSVVLLLRVLSANFRVDQGFLYSLTGCFAAEVIAFVLYRKAKERNKRTLFCKWPCFFAFSSITAYASGGKTGVASIPLALLCFASSLSCVYFYERIRGIKTAPFWKHVSKSVTFTLVLGFLNLGPSFAVLVPTRYLAKRHPYWNVFVSGFGFPAFSVLLRKMTMAYFMSFLKEKYEKGELPAVELLSKYSLLSKIVSVCLTLSNIVMMYLSKSVTGCVISALLSIFTEVSSKLFVVWSTRAEVNEQLRKRAGEAATRMQRINIAGPGVESNFEGNLEKVPTAEAKNLVLKELNKTPCLKAGDAVEEEEDEGSDKAGESVKESTERSKKDWEFVLGMLAARWEKDMVAEKSCIVVAAFLVHLFKFSEMSTTELAQVLLIFFGCEVVADFVLVYLLDKLFFVPLLRLQRNMPWNETTAELITTSQALLSVGLWLTVVNGIVSGVGE